MTRALEIPLYRLFTDDSRIKKPKIPPDKIPSLAVDTKQNHDLHVFAKLFSRMNEKNLRLLFHMASKMANRAERSSIVRPKPEGTYARGHTAWPSR
jgi:phage gp29-like protein